MQIKETIYAFFMQKIKDIHIGKIICQHLADEGRSKKWLAKKVHYEYSNFCKILQNQFIDTELLIRISIALKYDFFLHVSKHIAEKQNQNG